MQFDYFMAGSVAAHQFDPTTGTIQRFGQKAEQGLVGGGVHGRGGDFDSQFIAERFADFVGRSARLQFDGQQQSIGLDSQEGGW
jgi:hypothetical protein